MPVPPLWGWRETSFHLVVQPWPGPLGTGRAIVWLRADPRRLDLAIAAATSLIGTLLVLGAPDDYDAGWPEVATGVGAFVLVALRRWQPFVLLAVAMMWTTVHVAVWERPTPMVFALLVLLTTACVRLERWPAIGLCAVVAAWLYTIALITDETRYSPRKPKPADGCRRSVW